MAKKVAIAHCPFCGGPADVLTTSCLPYDDSNRYWVQCECSAGGANWDNEEDAVEAWNKRVTPRKRKVEKK